jgi:putative salt-induced outer membrane protein
LFPALLDADQIVMKNGDRLSGSITRHDGRELTMKSEFAGEVKIPWDSVVAVTSTGPLYVGLKDGQTVVGKVATVDGRFEIATETAGVVSFPREAVRFIRSEAAQKTYDVEIERLRNPRVVDLWTGYFDLGFAAAKGNTDTSTLTTGGSATRVTSRDKIGVAFTSIYSRNDSTGVSILTANTIRGGISYNLDISPKGFVFGSVDLEFDEFQGLDLRFVPAAGGGYHVAKGDRLTFDLFTGGSMNREFFATGLRRTSGEMLLGNELTRKIGGALTFREKLMVYPNLTDKGSVRVNLDASLAAALRRWLSLQMSISDRYISNPLEGRRKNDLLVTTGVRLTFAR